MKIKIRMPFFILLGGALTLFFLNSVFAHEKNYPAKKLAELLPGAQKIKTIEKKLSNEQVAWVENLLSGKITDEDKRPVFYLGRDSNNKAFGIAVFIDQTGPNGNTYMGVTAEPSTGKLNKAVVFSSGEPSSARNEEFLNPLKSLTPSEKWKKDENKSKEAIKKGIHKGLLLIQAAFNFKKNKK